jgi:hypothetical protein
MKAEILVVAAMALTGAVALGESQAGGRTTVTVPCIVNADLGFLVPLDDQKKVVLKGRKVACAIRLLKTEVIGETCKVSEGRENPYGVGYRLVPDTKKAKPGRRFVSVWIECDVPVETRCLDFGKLRLIADGFESEVAFGVGTEVPLAEGMDFTYLPWGAGVVQSKKGLTVVNGMHFGAGRLVSLARGLPSKSKFRLAFEVPKRDGEFSLRVKK